MGHQPRISAVTTERILKGWRCWFAWFYPNRVTINLWQASPQQLISWLVSGEITVRDVDCAHPQWVDILKEYDIYLERMGYEPRERGSSTQYSKSYNSFRGIDTSTCYGKALAHKDARKNRPNKPPPPSRLPKSMVCGVRG